VTFTNHPGFALAAVADATGPFCTQDFLNVVSRYDEGEGFVGSTDDAFIPLRRVDDVMVFAGDSEVTDYHTPRGDGSESLMTALAEETTAARFILDSLPEEAAKPLTAGLTNAGWRVQTRVHEVAAVLALPDTVDEYMSAIGKKQRHEVRRKRRRYEETVGKIRHETHQGQGWAFDEFLRLQRLAEGEKGEFMTPEREDMFKELAGLEGWRLDLLRTAEQSAAVVVFGYSDATGYYLYNSGYEPDLAEASPGVVLLGTLIEGAIDEGRGRFDFLKGGEAYKFRLGAERRPLTEIVATREGST